MKELRQLHHEVFLLFGVSLPLHFLQLLLLIGFADVPGVFQVTVDILVFFAG
jgi:hypothetical protein